MLHGMRSWTLMVRRRFFSAVSNHEARGPSFETRAKSALVRMGSEIASHPLRIRLGGERRYDSSFGNAVQY
jgi:hypothetical protein